MNKKLLIIGGLGFVGLYLFTQYRAAQALKSANNGLIQNKATMYEPSWSNPNAPKWGFGFDGKPAKIYSI